jgi:hypothetical protein
MAIIRFSSLEMPDAFVTGDDHVSRQTQKQAVFDHSGALTQLGRHASWV